jgi:hypothetical protein
MTAGTVNVYIPLRADNGERSTGIVPKGSRKRATFTRSVDVRTFFDPLADRNLANALPSPKPKAAPIATVAPRGWRLRPVEVGTAPSRQGQAAERPAKPAGLTCPRCLRSDFRTSNGLAWHVDHCASAERRSA